MKKQSVLAFFGLLMSYGAFAGDLLPSLGTPSVNYVGNVFQREFVPDQDTSFSLFRVILPRNSQKTAGNFVSSLRFVRLSSDGKELVTEMQTRSSFFTNFLMSKSDTVRVRANWTLKDCDGNSVQADQVRWDNIDSVVSSFQVYDFAQYMQCRFVRAGEVIVSDPAIYPESNYSASMSFMDTGEIQIKGTYANDYFRPMQASNPASDQAAIAAANTFVSFLKGYGNIMIQLRTASRTDRSTALEAYITRNKAQAIGALTTIRQTLGSTSLMTKLSVTVAINQGYSYVHAMEGSFQAAYPLDEVIVRP